MQSSQPRLLEHKVGIVTGASRGIGATVATRLADAGAHLVLAARDAGALHRLCDALAAHGGRYVPVPTDVTDPAAVEALVDRTVDTFGGLDLAVNNAGGGFAGKVPIAALGLDDFRAQLDLNLTSVFTAMTHQITAMAASGGGTIVNMSSGSGSRAAQGMGAYVVAKHGLQGLTKVAALDHAGDGVRINAVAPGPIMAGALADLDPGFQEQAAAAVPMGRIGSREDVAAAVAWLCSDEASFVTGATIPVDGGQVAGILTA